MQTINARIESCTLTTADHGLLSGWITLDYGSSGQGFGGFCLYAPPNEHRKNNGLDAAGIWIWRILEVLDLTDWSKVVGTPVRARVENGRGRHRSLHQGPVVRPGS